MDAMYWRQTSPTIELLGVFAGSCHHRQCHSDISLLVIMLGLSWLLNLVLYQWDYWVNSVQHRACM